ncbi:MAG TPA: hypothetical protein VF521_20015, partial [Pyrinomonadaceae bacterium]
QPVEVPGLEKLLPTHTAALAKIIIGNHLTAGENLQKFGSADLSFSAPGAGEDRRPTPVKFPLANRPAVLSF